MLSIEIATFQNRKLHFSRRTELASRLAEDEGKNFNYVYIWLLLFGLSAFYIHTLSHDHIEIGSVASSYKAAQRFL